jgi:integrase
MKRRPDGRWQKKIKLPNGKYKFLFSTASTERLAVKDFNEQILRLNTDEKNTMLFSAIADEWNDEYREKVGEINYKKATKASYNKIVDYFGDQYIESITAADISRYINKLAKQGYSQKTVLTAKSTLNAIFNYAEVFKGLNYNPTAKIELPKNLPKKARTMPTDAEIKIIDSHYDDFNFLPYFLLNTGLRKSEALALNYSDIDFDNKTITVNKHLIHDGNRPVLEHKTKTENAIRSVILLDRVADKLDRTKKGIIFCNRTGGHLTKREFDLRWKKWQKAHNINVTAHQLRHGFATMLFEAGVDLKDAQDLMGHSDIKTTQDIYTHIRDKRKKETANKLNNFSF